MAQADMDAATASSRHILWTGQGMAASDGAGVKLSRVIGQPAIPDMDPFLMLDEVGSDDPEAYIAGEARAGPARQTLPRSTLGVLHPAHSLSWLPGLTTPA